MRIGGHKQILFISLIILSLGFSPAVRKHGWYRQNHNTCIQWILFDRGKTVGIAMWTPDGPPETRLMAWPTESGWKAFTSLSEAKRAVEREARKVKAKK